MYRTQRQKLVFGPSFDKVCAGALVYISVASIVHFSLLFVRHRVFFFFVFFPCAIQSLDGFDLCCLCVCVCVGVCVSKVEYVRCDVERQKCIDAGVRGVPSWRIDGTTHAGYKPLGVLMEWAGVSEF